jgi:hypothetical protein
MERIVPSDHFQASYLAGDLRNGINRGDPDGWERRHTVVLRLRAEARIGDLLPHDRRVVECGKLTNRERRPVGLGR